MRKNVLHQAVQALYAFALETPQALPTLQRRDDLRKIPPAGVALWARESKRPTPGWFAYAGQMLSPRILVFWPVFLRNAGSQNSFQIPAWQLLNLLLPVIEHFDAVLVHLIKTLTLEDMTKQPEPLAVNIFKNHLRDVTADRRFRRLLGTILGESLRDLRDKKLEDELRTCPSKTHYSTPESRCDFCRGMEWVLYGVHYLKPDGLSDIGKAQLRFSIPDKITGRLPNTGHGEWNAELRWLMSCLTPDEGAVTTNDGKLLVNFARVNYVAAEFKRETPLRRTVGDSWSSGLASYDEAMHHFSSVVAARETPLMEMVQAQGWEVRDVIRAPYELLDLQKIYARFDKTLRLVSVRKRRPNPPQGRRDVVALEYTDPNGEMHQIRCFRRMRRNHCIKYYSVPWLKGVAPAKKDYFYRMHGEPFWSLHGVVNQPRPDSERKILEHFEKWLAQTDLRLTEGEFRRLIYDQKLPERLQKVVSGKQAHLSVYSRTEDAAITEIANLRAPGRFTDAQKIALTTALPGRQWLGIKRRYEQLAFRYAVTHGWAAYLASGWKTNNLRKREARWKKKGVMA